MLRGLNSCIILRFNIRTFLYEGLRPVCTMYIIYDYELYVCYQVPQQVSKSPKMFWHSNHSKLFAIVIITHNVDFIKL